MANNNLYINSTCSISANGIAINGQKVFESGNGLPAEFLEAAYKHFQVEYPKFYKMDHLAQLGFLAVELLLKEQDFAGKYESASVGLVFNNANASLDADVQYVESIKNIPSPAQFVYTLPNIVMGEVSIRHGLKGENAFFVSQDFDAGLMYWYVQDLFARNRVNACICGWIDFLADSYKAVVYLVEKTTGTVTLNFDIDNIHKIYELSNGEING